MQFQSFAYLLFFIIVITMAFVTRGKWQRMILLAASLFFYAYGSLHHLWLLLGIILETYGAALLLQKHRSKAVLVATLTIAFLPLAVCKYVPFFGAEFFPQMSDSFRRISLPIGISFFTFQSVSYVIDVWRGKIAAEKNLLDYSLFISFFPQLVAGPIERADRLLQQLKQPIHFHYEDAAVGMTQMGIGLFLKLFIADRAAYLVDLIYKAVPTASGVSLLLATFLFGIQIYCDFFGYSTIAIGSARVLGIELSDNFRQPYFSITCTEFWRRWHISLSSWFRDYVYIPLGGNRRGRLLGAMNLIVTFALSGLWHGANWTFLIWGGLNGCYLAGEKLLRLDATDKTGGRRALSWFRTWLLINLSWVFFRSSSVSEALTVFVHIGQIPKELLSLVTGQIGLSALLPLGGLNLWNAVLAGSGIALLIVYSVYSARGGCLHMAVRTWKPAARYCFYVILLATALCFGCFATSSPFIYFRF